MEGFICITLFVVVAKLNKVFNLNFVITSLCHICISNSCIATRNWLWVFSDFDKYGKTVFLTIKSIVLSDAAEAERLK